MKDDTGSNTVEDAKRFAMDHAEPVDDDDCDDGTGNCNEDTQEADLICCNSPHCGCGGSLIGVTLRQLRRW